MTKFQKNVSLLLLTDIFTEYPIVNKYHPVTVYFYQSKHYTPSIYCIWPSILLQKSKGEGRVHPGQTNTRVAT